ncbi:MAG: sulfur carrier protein ThiS [Stappiaceae bacterium]
MLIEMNGTQHKTQATTLQRLCDELEFDPLVVATALNGDFIPREERGITGLTNGDRVEIFAPMQGG